MHNLSRAASNSKFQEQAVLRWDPCLCAPRKSQPNCALDLKLRSSLTHRSSTAASGRITSSSNRASTASLATMSLRLRMRDHVRGGHGTQGTLP
jgi:hypothetical protein